MKTIHIFLLILLITVNIGHSQVAINTDGSSADNSAILDAKSTTKGVLIPRMTYDQRNAITSPAEGLMVFCTNCGLNNTGMVCIYSNAKWNSLNPCNTVTPAAGTHVSSQQQITWNWNTVPGAFGYKWNTTANYATATDMGTATSKTETGLTCQTTYTRYVWAYFDCGISAAYPISASTLGCWICGQPITDSRDSKVYNTVLIGTQCWMKSNLNIGTRINAVTTSLNNSIIEKYCYLDLEDSCSVYGGLYTWNEMMNYTTTSSSNPSGRQGICPSGWHLPSNAEWDQLVNFLGGASVAGAALKEDGYRHWLIPNLYATNTSGFTALPGGMKDLAIGYANLSWEGDFWTATAFSVGLTDYSYVRSLSNNDASVMQFQFDKVTGASVRCLKD